MNRQVKDIKQAFTPSIEIIKTKDNGDFSLEMDYGMENEDPEKSWFKFRTIIKKNEDESIKIKHGWIFKSPDDALLATRNKEMFDFFTHLIMASFKECNKLLISGKIEPPREFIFKLVERSSFMNLN